VVLLNYKLYLGHKYFHLTCIAPPLTQSTACDTVPHPNHGHVTKTKARELKEMLYFFVTNCVTTIQSIILNESFNYSCSLACKYLVYLITVPIPVATLSKERMILHCSSTWIAVSRILLEECKHAHVFLWSVIVCRQRPSTSPIPYSHSATKNPLLNEVPRL